MKKNQFGDNAEILWTDKKRIFGMPISFTRYSLVTNNNDWTKLFVVTGILSTTIDEINLFRVSDIQCIQTVFQRIFGVGTITLYSKDMSMPVVHLTNIAEPFKVRNMLTEKIEQARAEKGVRIGEFF